jgi:hypothetical protein
MQNVNTKEKDTNKKEARQFCTKKDTLTFSQVNSQWSA